MVELFLHCVLITYLVLLTQEWQSKEKIGHWESPTNNMVKLFLLQTNNVVKLFLHYFLITYLVLLTQEWQSKQKIGHRACLTVTIAAPSYKYVQFIET